MISTRSRPVWILDCVSSSSQIDSCSYLDKTHYFVEIPLSVGEKDVPVALLR